MDADKLADFGNIKTAHGDVKTAFRIFGFQGLLSLHNKDFLQCFIIRQSFSGTSMYCGSNRMHYLIFLQIQMGKILQYPTE